MVEFEALRRDMQSDRALGNQVQIGFPKRSFWTRNMKKRKKKKPRKEKDFSLVWGKLKRLR